MGRQTLATRVRCGSTVKTEPGSIRRLTH
jgi:hypothetical protein